MSLLSYGSAAVLTKQSLKSNGEHHINISSLPENTAQHSLLLSCLSISLLFAVVQCSPGLRSRPAAAQYYCVARRAGLATVIRTAASSFLQNC